MGKGLKAIEEIKNSFQLLIEKNKQLAGQNEKLDLKVKELEDNIKSKAEEVAELNEKFKILKMTKKLDGSNVGNNKELKLKINEMVREIDKCIALLNK